MKSIHIVIAVAVIQCSTLSLAAEFPAQARLFMTETKANPQSLNQEMTAQGLKEFGSVSKFGVEITYPLAKYLEVGINYSKRSIEKDETISDPNTEYHANLTQDVALLVARVPFFKTEIVRLDVFAGIGGSNTGLTVKTATQDGELSRKESNDWFASVTSSYGASVAVGYKKFFFYIEGGFESNKVDSFKRDGNINSNIQSMDLSGGYATVGILFDGITATSR
jgi:hypothetical protein